MSYRSVKEILNAVFDSSDNTLKALYKTEGEVFNLIYDEDANALKVNIDGFTGGTGGIIDGEVAAYTDLPAPADNAGKIYIVQTTTGVLLINRKQAGMYRSDGTSWNLLDVNLSAEKVYYSGSLSSDNVLGAIEELNSNIGNSTVSFRFFDDTLVSGDQDVYIGRFPLGQPIKLNVSVGGAVPSYADIIDILVPYNDTTKGWFRRSATYNSSGTAYTVSAVKAGKVSATEMDIYLTIVGASSGSTALEVTGELQGDYSFEASPVTSTDSFKDMGDYHAVFSGSAASVSNVWGEGDYLVYVTGGTYGCPLSVTSNNTVSALFRTANSLEVGGVGVYANHNSGAFNGLYNGVTANITLIAKRERR